MSKRVEHTEEEQAAIREKKIKNLKPFPKSELMTNEERERQHKIALMGGQANKERLANKKTMNELAKALLDRPITKEQAIAIIGEDAQLIQSDELTVSQVLNVAMVQESLKGNVKAYESIRDTAGYGIKQAFSVDIQADIMTDTDRALLDKLASRLNTIKAD